MALYAFDGTWNTLKDNDETAYRNTNVVRFRDAYGKTTSGNFYVQGVGTRFDKVGQVLGGVFGLGELARLNEAYDHLCAQWAAGDTIIDIIGFSRGAATTLDFCHMIQKRGIRAPHSDDVVEAQPQIRFLGVWDIVAAFGLANLGATWLNIGHHLDLPKANLKYAFHALALDERRPSFLPTRIRGACEVWFRGVHSDIGGGNGNRGLNDVTLRWMMTKARACGLPIADDDIAALKPDPTAAPQPAAKLKLDLRDVSLVDRRHHTIGPSTGFRNPPDTCPIENPENEGTVSEVGADGLTVMPVEFRHRVGILAETAARQAEVLEADLSGAREALLTLIEGRIVLVKNEADLKRAQRSTAKLVVGVVDSAKKLGFFPLTNEYGITEALYHLRPLYPFTDDETD